MAAKAQMSFTSGNALKLLLILIIGVSFVTFVTYGSGNINNFMREVCEKYPDLPFCAGISGVATTDYQTASNSAQALACAINSVAKGGEDDCIKNFRPSSPFSGPVASAGMLTGPMTGLFTGAQVSSDYEIIRKEISCWGCEQEDCNRKCEEELCRGMSNCELIKKELDTSGTNSCICEARIPGGTLIDCEPAKDKLSCTVYNFQLPQDVEGAEEWINGFGDPRFLVFWQSFPPGEHFSWSSMSAWFSGVRTILFASMCIGGVLGRGLSIIRHPVKASVSGIKGGVATGGWVKRLIKGVLKKFKIVDVTDDIVASPGGRQVMFRFMKESLKDRMIAKLGTSWTVFKKIAPRVGVYTGITTTGAYYAARFDTEIGKFVIVRPNKIVMQEALNTNPEENVLTAKTESGLGMPVILEKDYLLNKYTPFFLASPCHADLTIEKTKVKCTSYSYDGENDKTECFDPDPKSSSGLQCTWNISDYYLKKGYRLWIDPKAARSPEIEFVQNTVQEKKGIRIFEKDSNGIKVFEPASQVGFYFVKSIKGFEDGVKILQSFIYKIGYGSDDYIWVHCPGKDILKFSYDMHTRAMIEYARDGDDIELKTGSSFDSERPTVYFKFAGDRKLVKSAWIIDGVWKWKAQLSDTVYKELSDVSGFPTDSKGTLAKARDELNSVKDDYLGGLDVLKDAAGEKTFFHSDGSQNKYYAISTNEQRGPSYLYNVIRYSGGSDCEIEYEESNSPDDRKSDGSPNDKTPDVYNVYYKYSNDEWEWKSHYTGGKYFGLETKPEGEDKYTTYHGDKDRVYGPIRVRLRGLGQTMELSSIIIGGETFPMEDGDAKDGGVIIASVDGIAEGDEVNPWCTHLVITIEDDEGKTQTIQTDSVVCGVEKLVGGPILKYTLYEHHLNELRPYIINRNLDDAKEMLRWPRYSYIYNMLDTETRDRIDNAGSVQELLGILDDINDYLKGKFPYPDTKFSSLKFTADENREPLLVEFFYDDFKYISYSDENSDGYADGITTTIVNPNTHEEYYMFLEDFDGDKEMDTIALPECDIDGIKVSVNEGPYEDDEHNYCYQEKSEWISIGTTVGMFAVDALVRKIPHPAAQVAGIAVDCALAYISMEYEEKPWPD
jgi:hypothetical protein